MNGATGAEGRGQADRDFALVGATLLDGTGREPVAPAALHVREGRVAWVGPLPWFRRGPDTRVEDTTGLVIIPGLRGAKFRPAPRSRRMFESTAR